MVLDAFEREQVSAFPAFREFAGKPGWSGMCPARAALVPGASLSAAARRHGIGVRMLFRWKKEPGRPSDAWFLPVVVTEEGEASLSATAASPATMPSEDTSLRRMTAPVPSSGLGLLDDGLCSLSVGAADENADRLWTFRNEGSGLRTPTRRSATCQIGVIGGRPDSTASMLSSASKPIRLRVSTVAEAQWGVMKALGRSRKRRS